MARVLTKKSTVPGKVPLAADLEIGELAVNTADAKLYTKHSDNTIKQLGGDAASGYFRTEPITATSSGQTSFTVPGGYTPGAIFVSLNGATLPPADFTATDGATVVLASGDGIVAGSVLLVHVLSAFQVADALPLGGTAADSGKLGGQLPALYLNDMLSSLAASEVLIGAATTLTLSAFGRMHACTGTTANYTVTLPSASGNAGKIIGIRMAASLSRLVTVAAAGSDLIDGQAQRVMWSGESAVLMCTGSGWTKIAGVTKPMSFLAWRNGSAALAGYTLTKVALNTVEINYGGAFDQSTERLNILRPGAWMLAGSANFDPGQAGGAGIVQCNKNGGTFQQLAFGHFSSSTNMTLSGSGHAGQLIAGDYFDLNVYATFATSIGGFRYATFFSGQEVPQW